MEWQQTQAGRENTVEGDTWNVYNNGAGFGRNYDPLQISKGTMMKQENEQMI